MNTKVVKAIIPAAGMGTRFLPASKAIPKEMIPVVDKPAIQYVVEEAVAAGLQEICIITATGKEAMAEHFSPNADLETALTAKNDAERLALVRETSALANLSFVFQGEPKGLGHAVHCAADWVGDDPFAVLLGDDFLDADDYVLDVMVQIQERTGGSVVLLLEVPERLIRLYGSVDPTRMSVAELPHSSAASAPSTSLSEDIELYRISRLNEKPAPGEEYSNLAVIGRYVFNPKVMEVLAQTPPGRGGEVQLTDAIDTLARMPAAEGGGVYGVVFRGVRYDTGDKLEYLKAVVQLGVKHPQIGPDFAAWLQGFAERS